MLLAITFSSKHRAVNEMSKNVAETGATNDITNGAYAKHAG
jgi:hypothetical protein